MQQRVAQIVGSFDWRAVGQLARGIDRGAGIAITISPHAGRIEVLERQPERIHDRVTRRTRRVRSMLGDHLADGQRPRRADVFLVQRRDVLRGVCRWHAYQVCEDEGPPQHRRRPVRVRRRHQHGAFAEQPPARRLLELDPPEAIAFHIGDPVMKRDALVEIRVLRSQQIDHAAVFSEDAVGEERQLGAEILARI